MVSNGPSSSCPAYLFLMHFPSTCNPPFPLPTSFRLGRQTNKKQTGEHLTRFSKGFFPFFFLPPPLPPEKFLLATGRTGGGQRGMRDGPAHLLSGGIKTRKKNREKRKENQEATPYSSYFSQIPNKHRKSSFWKSDDTCRLFFG